MDPIVIQVLAAGAVELVVLPVLVAVLVRVFGNRLDRFDAKRERAREELAEHKRQQEEHRAGEHAMILAMARTMLLNNYENCVSKGYYSRDEREVFGKLYSSYASEGGNGVIEIIAERIRKLPLEPPDKNDINRGGRHEHSD